MANKIFFRLAKGWEAGKTVALYGQKQKLIHVTEREKYAVSYPGPPSSVRELHFLPLSQAQLAEKHALRSFDSLMRKQVALWAAYSYFEKGCRKKA